MPSNSQPDSTSQIDKRATPAEDTVAIQDAKLRHVHLPKAINKIIEIMDTTKNDNLAFAAATWVANLYLERADKKAARSGSDEVAIILARTLRDILPNAREIPILEGRWKDIEHDAGKPLVLGRLTDGN